MKINLSEIAFVLDRSGSMFGCLDATINGFNEFLLSQQQQPGEARFTLALFNDGYEVPCASIPIAEVTPLDDETYVPLGGTALLDAIVHTVDALGSRLAALPEDKRPGQVMVAILTDGEENSSSRFTWTDVASRIRHQTDVYNWTFLFLGANQDSIATAARMSIAAQNAASYPCDDIGSYTAYRSTARKMNALRAMQRSDATVEDQRLASASMSDIVAEDDLMARDPGTEGGNP